MRRLRLTGRETTLRSAQSGHLTPGYRGRRLRPGGCVLSNLPRLADARDHRLDAWLRGPCCSERHSQKENMWENKRHRALLQPQCAGRALPVSLRARRRACTFLAHASRAASIAGPTSTKGAPMMPLSRRAAMPNVAREGAACAETRSTVVRRRAIPLRSTTARGTRRWSLPCVAGRPPSARRNFPLALAPSGLHYARHV